MLPMKPSYGAGNYSYGSSPEAGITLVAGWDSGWHAWQGWGFSRLGEAAATKIASSVLTMTKPLLR